MAAPALVAPEDGAEVGSLITFSVEASQKTTIFVRPQGTEDASFRLVVLPDTQFYTTTDNLDAHGDLFSVQTQWIADHAEDVAFVTHLGDIVQDWDDLEQWAVADAAMSMLDDVVPYGLVVGNHDIPLKFSEKNKQGLFNDYFPISRFDKQPWWGGGYPDGSNDHSYQTFSAGGLDVLILHLRFEADELARQWASEVIAGHPDHRVIISTHSFLGEDGEVWVLQSYDPIETIWADLVEPYDNVFLILSAHRSGEARRTDYIGTRPVHQLLACYQAESAGGGTRMRLLDFIPGEDRIDVSTYLPLTDAWEDDSDSTFSLDYGMSSDTEVGSGEPESGLLRLEWAVPESGAYEWFAESASGERSEIFQFTADADPPVISDLLVSGLAADGIALVTWATSEPTTGSIWIDGEERGAESVAESQHAVEIKALPAAFEIQLFVTDIAGNVSSTKPFWVELGQEGTPADSGSPPQTAEDTGDDDTGQLAPADCGGCRSAAGGGGGWFLWLLVLLRRAATRSSASVS